MRVRAKDKQPKRIAIVGASSAIAENCARIWGDKGDAIEFILIGRNAERIKRVARDLQVRHPCLCIQEIVMDFLSPHSIQKEVDKMCNETAVDIVLIAHGLFPDQSQCQKDLHQCCEVLEVNGISPVLYAEAFAQHMEKAGRGTIALIGGTAGDIGRKSNYTYGAAKSLVVHYVHGLQHRFANSSVKIVLAKPGPTDTPMAAHLKEKGKGISLYYMCPVEVVARQIIDAIEKGKPVVYTPRKWQFVLWVIKRLPRFIFNRMNI